MVVEGREGGKKEKGPGPKGGRKKEEGRRKKEEGGRRKEEGGRRKKEEGSRKKEEGKKEGKGRTVEFPYDPEKRYVRDGTLLNVLQGVGCDIEGCLVDR